jgi:hypothetical protein
MLTITFSGGWPRRVTQSALWIIVTAILLLAAPASAASSEVSEARTSEIVASIKESGNVVFYSTNHIPNRLPISLETVHLSASDDVELIDVRDSERRFLRFKQDIGNDRNISTILCDKPVPVDGSLGLFTVSLHKDLITKRKDTLVFEYDYTPDSPTTLKFTAILPESATPSSVEPEPKEKAGRRYTWEYDIDADRPFACRIKYTQEASFGLGPIRDAEGLEKMASHTNGYWRDTRKGAGWAWFFKKGLIMPNYFKFSVNMKTIKTIGERKRFGIMLDPTDTGYFDRPKSESKADPWADPWGKAAYCFFWSNIDAEKGFTYGVLRNGELVLSKKAPPIKKGKEYELTLEKDTNQDRFFLEKDDTLAMEKEINRFRFYVDGEMVIEYDDQELLWPRHMLRIGVHGPMSGQELREFSENNKEWWKGGNPQKKFDKLDLTYIGYSNRKFELIGGDLMLLEHKQKIEPVNTIDPVFLPDHVFIPLTHVIRRMNGFEAVDFSPSASADLDRAADIDLSKIGFAKVSSEPIKKVNLGGYMFPVPSEYQPVTRRVNYARKGSPETVLSVLLVRTSLESQAFGLAYSVSGNFNFRPDFSAGLAPYLARAGFKRGNWVVYTELPLEEANPQKMVDDKDTIHLLQRSIVGEILMHFYEMDMTAQ